jgi:hypothetical protein
MGALLKIALRASERVVSYMIGSQIGKFGLNWLRRLDDRACKTP